MNYKISLIVVITFLCCLKTTSGKCNDPASFAKIVLHVTSKNTAQKELKIEIIKDYTYESNGAEEYHARADRNGNYMFTIKKLTGPARLRIGFENFSFIDSYIEPGDNIVIKYSGEATRGINNKELVYLGKGSDKFKIIDRINSAYSVDGIYGKIDSLSSIKRICSKFDSIYTLQKKMLVSNKSIISRKVYEVIDADIYGSVNFKKLWFLDDEVTKRARKKEEIKNYLFEPSNWKYYGFSKMALQSKMYVEYLIKKAKLSAVLSGDFNKPQIKKVYNELIKENSGYTREKIIVSFLLRNKINVNQDDIDYVFLSALKDLKNERNINIIKKFGENLITGASCYPFSLPDTNGKMVSIENLKGKILLLDFWFTGCSACSILSKDLENHLLPKFINNPNVVFISICVDKDKQRWKKSVKSGMYTNSQNVNLFTEGLGMDHPFIQYYKFVGCPQLMLIDKNSHIISSALVRNPRIIEEAINNELNKN